MTAEVTTATVRDSDGALRLDRWFRRHYPTLGHGEVERLLRTGQIRVDGKRARAADRVVPGQTIRIPPLPELRDERRRRRPALRPRDAAMAEAMVLHRDNDLLVLNKPPGLPVQGGTGAMHHLDGLLDALRFGSEERPRLVHRLDKDTSGILVVARTASSAAFLTRAFRDKRTRKIYWAIVAGVPKPRQGRIDLPLAKSVRQGGERVRADSNAGKHAVTYYSAIDSAGARASWVALLPITGRTHQLRAHCAALGTPILGDGKYGGGAARLSGLADSGRLHLHARALTLPHPSGGMLQVIAALPPHLRRSWAFFGFAQDAADPFADLDRVR